MMMTTMKSQKMKGPTKRLVIFQRRVILSITFIYPDPSSRYLIPPFSQVVVEDDLKEIDPTHIMGRRTRGVKVDYTSKEALEKAGLQGNEKDEDSDEDVEMKGVQALSFQSR